MNPKRNKGIEETYVGIELTDEAGEVVVLEIGREKEASELGRVPHDEAVVGRAPRNDVVGGGIVHHVVGLQKERRRTSGTGGLWRTVHFGMELIFPEPQRERELSKRRKPGICNYADAMHFRERKSGFV